MSYLHPTSREMGRIMLVVAVAMTLTIALLVFFPDEFFPSP
jgi:hypothetical protein